VPGGQLDGSCGEYWKAGKRKVCLGRCTPSSVMGGKFGLSVSAKYLFFRARACRGATEPAKNSWPPSKMSNCFVGPSGDKDRGQSLLTCYRSWKARGRPASRRTSSTVDVLALRHPLQWDGGDGGTMATRLRQFEPHPTLFADFEEECARGDPQEVGPQKTREKQIDDVLSKFMAPPYIRDATKLQPFLKDAKRAIAAYEGARETKYDRPDAKRLLTETLTSLETARRKLQEIAWWPELSKYLKDVYRDAIPTERPEPSSSREQVEQARQRTAALDRSYSQFAPNQIVWCLSHLETVLSLAAEQVTFGPGDAQRDRIAQDFADQLASAWHSATERLPTYSRPTPRLKNCSPFARLLETINQEVLEKRHRSPNNFLEYGIKSVKRFRQLIGIKSVKRKSVKRFRR
jgi:hypothetical protein